MGAIEEAVGNAVVKLAKDIDAEKIILIEHSQEDEPEHDKYLHVRVTIFRNIHDSHQIQKAYFQTYLRKSTYGSLKAIKELIIECIDKKCLFKGDKVVCVADESVGVGYKSFIFIFDVDEVLFNISRYHLSENIHPSIIEAVLMLCQEISEEGREGRKIGTSFIVGQGDDVLKYSRQLILNPFRGYEEKLNITDPEIKETIKEYAQLDGSFLVHTDGTMLSAGAYIDVNTEGIDFPGLGTRHRNCAALTKVTPSLAFVVSSSGTVRIFKEGKVVFQL